MIPPCSGGRSSSGGRLPRGEDVLDGGEDPLVERHAGGQRARRLDVPAAGDEGGERVAADEAPAAPALAVLDGLEQEAGLVAHDAQERATRAWTGRPAPRATPG